MGIFSRVDGVAANGRAVYKNEGSHYLYYWPATQSSSGWWIIGPTYSGISAYTAYSGTSQRDANCPTSAGNWLVWDPWGREWW